jgi:hypothetical protein
VKFRNFEIGREAAEQNSKIETGRFQSGQMGRTVNPLSFDFGGSNPPLPTASAVALAKAGWIKFLVHY